MRGSFRKKKAKITSIELKDSRVILEGIQRSKKDGTKVNVYFHPSKLQIQSLNLDDKKRLLAIERKLPNKNPKQESKEKSMEKKNALKETKGSN